MRLRIMDSGQWKTWTLALEDVVADGCIGRRNGRQWTDEGVKMRTVDVIVTAAPQYVTQVAGNADGFASVGFVLWLINAYIFNIQHNLSSKPLRMIVVRILHGVQMHLARFLILRAQIVHQMVDCVPGKYFEHL